jgi:hypothetical protein
MNYKELRSRLRSIELPQFKSEHCANRACGNRTRPWHGHLGTDAGLRCEGQWCCSDACFEAVSQSLICRALLQPQRHSPRSHRLPLGLLMVSNGTLSHDVVRRALEAQRRGGAPIGRWLRTFGGITEQQIAEAVAQQWSCALYPLERDTAYLSHADLVPFPLLERSRMVPVHRNPHNNSIHLAFADSLDYSALYAIEQMLGAHTVPCIARESAVDAALNMLNDFPRPQLHVFEAHCEPSEAARMARSYVGQVAATDVRIVRSGEYLWIRLRGRSFTDLLFRNKWMTNPELRPIASAALAAILD